jgi:hypothetical protein
MLVAIHQPHYLPWLRYVDKIARSDVFIVLDDVQYEKNGYQNRNSVKTCRGATCLTVPVRRPTQAPLTSIRIAGDGWCVRHRRALEQNYGGAAHFAACWPGFASVFEQEWSTLVDLNVALLGVILTALRITTPLVRSSTLRVRETGTRRLARLCREVGGTGYLSGAHALGAYLDPVLLHDSGLRLAVHEWQAPVYRQRHPSAGFVPDLSVVDLLFNEGPGAPQILASGGAVSPFRAHAPAAAC